VVVPEAIRLEIAVHAREEEPNEACGLLAFRDGVATRYERGRNAARSPYRFQLEVDPELWFLEDEGYELAVVHSHPPGAPTGARPSSTDVANVGLWEGRPYFVYFVGADELRAWRIADGEVVELPAT
jgi:proteasome lid subunit RPN8/RPN11